MVFLLLPLLFLVAVVLLYRVLLQQRSVAALWRAAALIGLAVGLVRGVLAPFGWYVLEHNGGPLQIPAYALSMLAWPEAALFSSLFQSLLPSPRTAPAPVAFHVLLAITLLASSFAAVTFVAVVARANRPGPE